MLFDKQVKTKLIQSHWNVPALYILEKQELKNNERNWQDMQIIRIDWESYDFYWCTYKDQCRIIVGDVENEIKVTIITSIWFCDHFQMFS